MVSINCNTEVIVKLTPYGRQVWIDWHTQLGLNYKEYEFNFKKVLNIH